MILNEKTIKQITALAHKLPSKLPDPKALEKLDAEMRELREAVDPIDRAMEAADVLYYAVKANASDLIEEVEIKKHLREISKISGWPEEAIINACITKYQLRARPGNPKNHAEERAAVKNLIENTF